MNTLCVLLFSLYLFRPTFLQTADEIKYYKDLILSGINNATIYEFPTYSQEFQYVPDEIHDFGEYDFIIVGAGSAGAVVANRLAEETTWKILLLEAGKQENTFTDIPAMLSYVLFSEYNWGYKSTPQDSICLGAIDKRCNVPRGKGLGGTSLVNGMSYSRGCKWDYDYWESLGNKGWSYENVLPYFKKSENADLTYIDEIYHGKGGYLNIEEYHNVTPIYYAFEEGMEALGYEVVDYNAKENIGVSPMQLHTVNGRRASTGKSFLSSGKPNLKIKTESLVTRILIDSDNTAYGVEFIHNGKRFVATSSKEIVLSAGALNSPQLLILSGVGPIEELEKHNIPLVKELPVGQNMKDHVALFFVIHFSTNYTAPLRTLEENIWEYLNGYGVLTHALSGDGIAYLKTNLWHDEPNPDIEIIISTPTNSLPFTKRVTNLQNGLYESIYNGMEVEHSFTLNLMLLRSKSTGSVTLNSKDPLQYPNIDLNLLTHPEDMETLLAGIRFLSRLTKQDSFKKFNTTVLENKVPECKHHNFYTDEYWRCAIPYVATSAYHFAGTCGMGVDESSSVVNSELKVHGIQNLRVIDTSVVPQPPSGHMQATAVMIGEKGSDIIKKAWRII